MGRRGAMGSLGAPGLPGENGAKGSKVCSSINDLSTGNMHRILWYDITIVKLFCFEKPLFHKY